MAKRFDSSPCAGLLAELRSFDNIRTNSPRFVMADNSHGSSQSGLVKCVRCPTDELSLRNVVVVSQADFNETTIEHICVTDSRSPGAQPFIFRTANHPAVKPGEIAFNRPQRQWGNFSLGQDLEAKPHKFNSSTETISTLVLEVDFQTKKNTTTEQYDSGQMAHEVLMQFSKFPFTVGQMMVFTFQNKKMLQITVKELEAMDFNSGKTRSVHVGVLSANTVVTFDKAPDSYLNLVGKARGKQQYQSIISPDWDFNKMGIGGLDNEFSAIFRRAFASRVFPPDIIDQLGMKHVRGILLFGPPGTGKTLMARQIGKMLNAREPKIVNGPQILDKYVGESEANIRKLFADAEEEEKRCGPNSGLHIIIFDEIDAICKARGSVGSSTAVHDTVVNQLLSKIDGVDQLNNILIIGMTNRKDMIDEALLRPGRLEVQMEISLPDEHGRVQILNIHTARMKEHNKLDTTVNIAELATRTKNFSGAELEGLVRAATSTAMNRLVKASSKVEIAPDAVEKLKVTQADFHSALLHDIKPAFGSNAAVLENHIMNGIIRFDRKIDELLENGKLLGLQAKQSDRTPLITVLLEGPPGSGKTALAAQIAMMSDFPLMKICSPEDMIGFHETAKCLAIKKLFDDAYKSPLSLIIVDDIERLLDYAPIGPRFSNLVLQALLVLLKKPPPSNRKLMIIGTTNHKDVLDQLDMLSVFNSTFHVYNVTNGVQLVAVLNELDECFSQEEIDQVRKEIGSKRMHVGIKRLLNLIDMSLQSEPGKRVYKLVQLLQEDGGLDSFEFQ